MRRILAGSIHKRSDVAIGVVAPMKNNRTGKPLKNKIFSISSSILETETQVTTYAYSNSSIEYKDDLSVFNLNPRFYGGYIKEYYPNGRDKGTLPGPCYRTSMVIHKTNNLLQLTTKIIRNNDYF